MDQKERPSNSWQSFEGESAGQSTLPEDSASGFAPQALTRFTIDLLTRVGRMERQLQSQDTEIQNLNRRISDAYDWSKDVPR